MPTVKIDCFHEHLAETPTGAALVAIDVIRATTTAIAAAAAGWDVYPAGSIEAAVRLAADLDRPLLAGELGGVQPYGFDLQNSPTQIERLEPSPRPIILLSTSGTRLIAEASTRGDTYVSCLRNVAVQSRRLAQLGRDVAIFGADSRGEFREEDQLCSVRIAAPLVADGYRPADELTERLIERWAAAPDDGFLSSRSVKYLRDTDQEHDLRYVLEHVDDLQSAFILRDGRVVAEQ